MICILGMVLLMACLLNTAASTAGDVASAEEGTWKDAASQIKTVVDNVVFPRAAYDPCHCVLCQTGQCVLRLPAEGAV